MAKTAETAVKQRDYMRLLRAERREHHQCLSCGKQDELTLSGRSLCTSCQAKNTERRQRIRAYRRENHLCVRCGKQDDRTAASQYYCESCAEKCREKDFRREQRRRDGGMCISCGAKDERTTSGAAYCAACAEKNNDNQRKRRRANPEMCARHNAEKNATYYYMKRHHLCVDCKKQDAYTLAGHAYCHECGAKHNAVKRAKRAENREEYNRAARERRAAAIESGKCVSCGRPTENGHAQCPRCLAYRREKYAAERDPEINWPRGDNGFCYLCNKNLAMPGKRLCKACYDQTVTCLSKTYGGLGPTAPRSDDHPFKIAAKLAHEKRIERERKK